MPCENPRGRFHSVGCSTVNMDDLLSDIPLPPLEKGCRRLPRSRQHERAVRSQRLDLRGAPTRLAEHLDAILAHARSMAPKLGLGLLEVEWARERHDRAFGRVLALGEKTRRAQVRVFRQLLEGAHG